MLESGLVTRKDFDLARENADKTNMDVCDILTKQGKMSEDEWRDAQMKAFNIPFVDLRSRKIKRAVLSIIPEPLARQFGIIAFERDDRNLKVAILNLNDLEKIDFLKKEVKLRIIPALTDKVSISDALMRYQELLKDEYGAAIQKEFLSFQIISTDLLKGLSRRELLELARDKQINHIFELLLKHALSQNASNIHIEPQRDNVLVRYRIGEVLCPAMFLPKNAAIILALKIKIMSGLQVIGALSSVEKKSARAEICQDGRFCLGFDGKEINFQASITPSFWGERIVLNILREGDSGFSLEALGFHGRGLELLRVALDKREKLILIAGQKQSGRTTSFYTFLDLLKNPNLSVATMENSIEFQMAGISQTVANPEIGFDISVGVGQLAKQDMDVIAVDEADDFKIIARLFDIVNEDRFTFFVLETDEDSTAQIISKLDGAKISPVSVATGLGVVILQKLISRLPNQNRREYYLNGSEIKRLSKKADLEKIMDALVDEKVLEQKISWLELMFYKNNAIDDNDKSNLANGQGPNPTDGQGKIMVSEVLKISPVIKELIMKNASAEKIEARARAEGMLTLTEEIIFKAVQGLVSVEEIL